MKNIFQVALIGVLIISCKEIKVASKVPETISTALDIVNKRMTFYNEHNFDDFIKLYANDVEIYTYPDRLLGTGNEHISSIFKPKFASKSIQVKIVSQIKNGNYVINHEIVTEDGKDTKYVSIYEVKDGLITSVRFVRDN